jgi:hypothetical protein
MLSGVSIVRGVSPPAELPGAVVPPAATPQSIRACLTPLLLAEFDREWNFVLDEAKCDKDLEPIQPLLIKWPSKSMKEPRPRWSGRRDPNSHCQLGNC